MSTFDPPRIFDGNHCPICGDPVDVKQLDDGRWTYTCSDDDHTFGRLEPA
ncbi:hypothetical protein GRX01_00290 [Halobaculum sp. WSA2]|uniref:Uncharacterized protein n=1 Tax=Halobaculum saliterrae TaxID=2073113 RepID=A0A6B0SV46_9EURY|nr:hypothetical protein [Halobaculum saliterrae]MXR39800.1 hypothetical protein [Halobaculum saliterrae]